MQTLVVAQLVEQWTVNPFVAGSSPANETYFRFYGEAVITADFESAIPGSNPGGTSYFFLFYHIINMDGINTVTTTVSSTAQTSVSVAKKASSDVIQLQFYKNPVFITFTIYCLFIFGYYSNMSESTKNNYVFTDKFRHNGQIYWKYIVTYPYDPSKSTTSLVISLLTPPIILYLVFFSTLVPYFVNIKLVNYQSYFYALMFSYLILLILFTLHVIIFKYIINPSSVDVELTLGDKTKQVEKTYESFYRTQWTLLIFLSPIYVCILTYIMRKL